MASVVAVCGQFALRTLVPAGLPMVPRILLILLDEKGHRKAPRMLYVPARP